MCKVKKKVILSRKIRSVFWIKKKKLFERGSTFIRWIYFTCITFIKKKKKKKQQPNFQFLLLNFKTYNFISKKTFLKKSDLYLRKIQICFMYIKKIISVFNENIDQFCIFFKSNLYLMKIQICFMLKNHIWKIHINFWIR